MIKIPQNTYTQVLKKIIKSFGSLLSKPQLSHFVDIVKGMLFSSRKSINFYAKESKKDQSSLNRFMNSRAVDDDKLKNKNLDLITH